MSILNALVRLDLQSSRASISICNAIEGGIANANIRLCRIANPTQRCAGSVGAKYFSPLQTRKQKKIRVNPFNLRHPRSK